MRTGTGQVTDSIVRPTPDGLSPHPAAAQQVRPVRTIEPYRTYPSAPVVTVRSAE